MVLFFSEFVNTSSYEKNCTQYFGHLALIGTNNNLEHLWTGSHGGPRMCPLDFSTPRGHADGDAWFKTTRRGPFSGYFQDEVNRFISRCIDLSPCS